MSVHINLVAKICEKKSNTKWVMVVVPMLTKCCMRNESSDNILWHYSICQPHSSLIFAAGSLALILVLFHIVSAADAQ